MEATLRNCLSEGVNRLNNILISGVDGLELLYDIKDKNGTTIPLAIEFNDEKLILEKIIFSFDQSIRHFSKQALVIYRVNFW